MKPYFSPREILVLKVIGRKKMTLREISKELFKDSITPLDDTIVIANTVSRIIKKCEHRKLKWSLEKTKKGNLLFIKKVTL